MPGDLFIDATSILPTRGFMINTTSLEITQQGLKFEGIAARKLDELEAMLSDAPDELKSNIERDNGNNTFKDLVHIQKAYIEYLIHTAFICQSAKDALLNKLNYKYDGPVIGRGSMYGNVYGAWAPSISSHYPTRSPGEVRCIILATDLLKKLTKFYIDGPTHLHYEALQYLVHYHKTLDRWRAESVGASAPWGIVGFFLTMVKFDAEHTQSRMTNIGNIINYLKYSNREYIFGISRLISRLGVTTLLSQFGSHTGVTGINANFFSGLPCSAEDSRENRLTGLLARVSKKKLGDKYFIYIETHLSSVKNNKTSYGYLKELYRVYKTRIVPIIDHGLYGAYRRGLLDKLSVHLAFFSILRGDPLYFDTMAIGNFQEFNKKRDRRNPFSISLKELDKILTDGTTSLPASYYPPAVKLLEVFGSAKEVLAFVDKTDRDLHDAGQFSLPLNFKVKQEWRGIFMQSPKLIRHAGSMADVEKYLKRVPRGPKEFTEVLAKVAKADVALGLLSDFGVSNSEIADYTNYIKRNKPKKLVNIPAPGGIHGIKHRGYHLRQLSHDDPTQLYAGVLTHCCQHLHGAADSAAKAIWKYSDHAIWAVYRGDEMIAQSMVWKGKLTDGISYGLVLDSIEYGDEFNHIIARLFKLAARSVLGKLGVVVVYEGEKCKYLKTLKRRNGASGFTQVTANAPKRPNIDFYSDCGRACRVLVGETPDECSTGETPIAQYVRLDHRFATNYDYDGVYRTETIYGDE